MTHFTAMTYSTLLYEVRDGVAWITLNRPNSLNALNLESARELHHVANRCGSDHAVRAVVLTGAGDRAFCAGGDVAGFAVDPDHVDLLIKEMTTYLDAAVSRLAWMDAPVIAMVNGVAAGAGLSLVACCDLAIAGENARFTSAYTQVGLAPDCGSTYFLSRIIGLRRCAELYLTNRVLSAREALEWGLVNQVVAAEALPETVSVLAGELAQGPTLAHGGVKRLLRMAAQEGLESQMEREAREVAALSRTADGLEGARAFVERRKPVFRGL